MKPEILCTTTIKPEEHAALVKIAEDMKVPLEYLIRRAVADYSKANTTK